MNIKRILACLCASVMMTVSFTACGEEEKKEKKDKDDKEIVTEAPTEAETEAPTEAAVTEAPAADDDIPAVEGDANADANADAQVQAPVENQQVQAIVIEDSVVAQPGDAFLMFSDGRWVGTYYGGDPTDTLQYAAVNTPITGNGQYTVALDATTNGYQQMTGYADMQGLSFAALVVKEGTTLFPNMILTIDSIKLDGQEVEMTAKPYTSSDDGVEMRSNIYNGYVPADAVADDARTADGDKTGCSPQVVDPASFGTYSKIEVTFTVSGL